MNQKLLLLIMLFAAACGGVEDLQIDQTISEARRDDPEDPPDWPPPEENPPPPPPPAPTQPHLAIAHRSNHQVTVRWTDHAYNENATYLERFEPTYGSWTPIRTYGPVAYGSYDHTDTNLAADTRYCYRAMATGAGGSRVSPTMCAYTRGPSSKPIWRLQLRVGVADVSDAATDDGLHVQLNSSANNEAPRGNHTFLDYGHDDFERNSTFTYDLDSGAIGDIYDITQINLYKDGEDGVCLREFAVLVNGVELFQRTFGNTASTCRWLDYGGGHSTSFLVSYAELRMHPAFSGFMQPAIPMSIARAELESRIESLVGNAIAGTQMQWGHIYGRPVEISVSGPGAFHIDMDLEASADDAANPEVDVDIEMQVAFVPRNTSPVTWDLTFTTVSMNVSVDSDWWWEVLNYVLDPLCAPIATVVTGEMVWECNDSLESYIENRVRAGFKPLEKALNVGAQSCPPSVTVNGEGDLVFLGCPG